MNQKLLDDARAAGFETDIDDDNEILASDGAGWHINITSELAKFAELQHPKKNRLVSDSLLAEIENTLLYYMNKNSYQAPRIGGVVAGCPRGNKPSTEYIVALARRTYKKFEEELSKNPTDKDS